MSAVEAILNRSNNDFLKRPAEQGRSPRVDAKSQSRNRQSLLSIDEEVPFTSYKGPTAMRELVPVLSRKRRSKCEDIEAIELPSLTNLMRNTPRNIHRRTKPVRKRSNSGHFGTLRCFSLGKRENSSSDEGGSKLWTANRILESPSPQRSGSIRVPPAIHKEASIIQSTPNIKRPKVAKSKAAMKNDDELCLLPDSSLNPSEPREEEQSDIYEFKISAKTRPSALAVAEHRRWWKYECRYGRYRGLTGPIEANATGDNMAINNPHRRFTRLTMTEVASVENELVDSGSDEESE